MSSEIPFCKAARTPVRGPEMAVPARSCDTHAHVFAHCADYPFALDRTYTPPEASLEDYLKLHRILGIDRGVLVQPSVYGTDNSLHLHALRQLREQGHDYRGVCVVDPEITIAELEELHEAGFRGVRMNLLFRGGLQWKEVLKLADRIAGMGWHLQFLINVADCDDIMDRVAALPVPVVFDHMGHMPAALGVEEPGFQKLLKLLKDNKAWVKLSGSYRVTMQEKYPYPDVTAIAAALVAANADRCIWGSDWPHPHFPGLMPDDTDLLEDLRVWVKDPDIRERILVSNPSRLYDFND
ncbi:amidohydrolase family protein [Marinobacter orientalis]|uniref:Amidohydrolase family protein n=1 Tax=Marinobacter orientalis TaxID=1928859 RepID=A0A7Y0WTC8_9GAMM|nr:amidohydrolase family protein [Marinobacter orientalis]NMT64779.1 amidohydrolase family protein [Marinobacter orientalis]TGX48770.1 GntR family transcriptional regulator [Marinobacter orientalis]